MVENIEPRSNHSLASECALIEVISLIIRHLDHYDCLNSDEVAADLRKAISDELHKSDGQDAAQLQNYISTLKTVIMKINHPLQTDEF